MWIIIMEGGYNVCDRLRLWLYARPTMHKTMYYRREWP